MGAQNALKKTGIGCEYCPELKVSFSFMQFQTASRLMFIAHIKNSETLFFTQETMNSEFFFPFPHPELVQDIKDTI